MDIEQINTYEAMFREPSHVSVAPNAHPARWLKALPPMPTEDTERAAPDGGQWPASSSI